MSLKFKILSVIGLSLSIAGFSAVVSAQDTTTTQKDTTIQKDNHHKFERQGRRGEGPGFGGPRRGGPEGIVRGLRELNLTDAQKQQIHTILESNKPDQANFEEIRPLMEAKRNGTITAEQQEKLKAFHEQGRQKMEAVREQILNVLTAEQKQQLEQKRQEMEKRREQWQKNQPSTKTDKPTTDKPAAAKPTTN